MSDVARVASRDVAVFKPGEAKANDAKADAVIDFAKKVKDVNPHQRVGQGDGGEAASCTSPRGQGLGAALILRRYSGISYARRGA